MKYFIVNRFYPSYSWEVKSTMETNNLLKEQIKGSLRSKISSYLPRWEEAPVFYGEMVHQFSNQPLHLLSDEEYKSASTFPKFLPDILQISTIINNDLNLDGFRSVISDKLKTLMDERKVAGSYDSYKLKIKFSEDLRDYWLIVFRSEKTRFSLLKFIDYEKSTIKYKSGEEYLTVKPKEFKKLSKDRNYNLWPLMGEKRSIFLNDIYDFVLYMGQIYISKDIKSVIEREEILIGITELSRVSNLGEIITPGSQV